MGIGHWALVNRHSNKILDLRWFLPGLNNNPGFLLFMLKIGLHIFQGRIKQSEGLENWEKIVKLKREGIRYQALGIGHLLLAACCLLLVTFMR